MAQAEQDSADAGAGHQPGRHALREVVLEDVWSRTHPRYQRRAAVLLGISALIFAGLNIFAYWLQTFGFLDFSIASYQRAMLVGQLSDIARGPVSIQEVPMMIVIIGLTLGVLAAVPILVAQLYRFGYSLIFIVQVYLLAHMPVLAAVLLLSCFLAGSRRTRMQFKYASTLLGLIPVAIYYSWAMRPANPSGGIEVGSNDMLLQLAPSLVAILSAAAMGGIMLMIAHVVNMRPGAIAPVLTVFFAIPVILFHSRVGRDELRYRAIYKAYGKYSPESGETTFTKRELAAELGVMLWDESDVAALRKDVAELWSTTIERNLPTREWARRDDAMGDCAEFLDDFPTSPYVPAVLYMMGWVQDLRANPHRLRQDLEIDYYHDFPTARSALVWRRLVQEHPSSEFAAWGRLQLARLELRRARTAEALAYLDAIVPLSSSQPAGAGASALATMQASATRWQSDRPFEKLMPEIRRQAARLAYRIVQNRGDPRYGDLPLAELMRLDAQHYAYARQLQRLIHQYPDAKLTDNLEVLLVQCDPDIRRQQRLLTQYAAQFKGHDGGAEALFALGSVLRRLATELPAANLTPQTEACYRQLTTDYPDSPYAREARALSGLIPMSRPQD